MLLTVSIKARSVSGSSNIRSTKLLQLKAIGRLAQINLVIIQISELMAVSHESQTTRSLLKVELLLFFYIKIVF